MLSGTFHTLVINTEKLAAIFSNPEIKKQYMKNKEKQIIPVKYALVEA